MAGEGLNPMESAIEDSFAYIGWGIRKALLDIHREMEESYIEKGPVTTDLVRASALLITEASEVMCEALKMTNPGGKASHHGAKGTYEAMYYELTQVVNLALAMMLNLLKEMKVDEP